MEELKKILEGIDKSDLGGFDFGKSLQSVEKIQDRYLIKYLGEGIEQKSRKALESRVQEAIKAKGFSENVYFLPVGKTLLTPGHGPKPTQGGIPAKKVIDGVKNIVPIASGKGGVGKSTLAVNIAMSFAKKGFKVGLMDCDIYGPSLPTMFGIEGEKVKASEREGKKIEPIEKYGIKCMSFGHFVKENDAVIWRGPMLNGVVHQFLFDVNWGELDYLFLDLPPGTGDVQLSLVQATELSGVVIVSTPQDVAKRDVARAINMFQKMKIKILGIVENMASFVCDNCSEVHKIFGDTNLKGWGEKQDVPFLGEVSLNKKMRESGDLGVPYVKSSPAGDTIFDQIDKITKKIESSI